MLSDSAFIFNAAKTRCASAGGTLATAETPGKHDFLKTLMSESRRYWVGAYKGKVVINFKFKY